MAGKPRKPKPPPTEEELEALWRGNPNFIGPVGPPMWLWVRDREKQKAWRKQCGLGGIEDDEASR